MTISSISNGRHRWALTALAPALVAPLVALASPAAAAAKTFSVNRVTGNDSDSGWPTKPLKTLTRALKLAARDHNGTRQGWARPDACASRPTEPARLRTELTTGIPAALASHERGHAHHPSKGNHR